MMNLYFKKKRKTDYITFTLQPNSSRAKDKEWSQK